MLQVKIHFTLSDVTVFKSTNISDSSKDVLNYISELLIMIMFFGESIFNMVGLYPDLQYSFQIYFTHIDNHRT